MTENPKETPPDQETSLSREVGTKAARKLKAQHKVTRGIWFGFAMSGLIGWSVAVPTLFGAMLGIWIDKHYPSPHSWTLMLLLIGLILGCLNAWHWVAKEGRNMREEEENKDE